MSTTAVTGTQSATTSTTSSTGDTAQELNDRFLKLLVAQMQNQDPLNPLDNAEVTSQMAQINTVTGINTLNDTVSQLLDQVGVLETQQAAQLIGRDVLVAGSSLTVDAEGSAVAAGVELATAADSVKVEIYDSNGTLVRTLSLGAADAGVTRYSWDGKTDAGAQAAAGQYTIKVNATLGGEAVASAALVPRRVESVARSDGSTVLTMTDGTRTAYGNVKEIL